MWVQLLCHHPLPEPDAQLPPDLSLSLSNVENLCPFSGWVTKGSSEVMPVNPPMARGYSLLPDPTLKVL